MIFRKSASFVMILGCVAAVFFSCASSAGNIKTRFFEADNCSRALAEDPQKQKYRSHWEECINAFMEAYQQEPAGQWASASLYRAAVLYADLYKRSARTADREEAVDLFNRIVLRFPNSAYSAKAKEQLAALSDKVPVKTPAVTTPQAGEKTKKAYARAERSYKALLNSPAKQKYRSVWQECIDAYHGVYKSEPSGPLAAESLYMAGKLYTELRRHSFRDADRERGVELLGQVAREFPRSPAAAKAAADLGAIPGAEVPAAPAPAPLPREPLSDEALQNAASASYCLPPPETAPVPEGQAVVEGLRFWSNPAYTRVVIDTNKQITYTHNLLKQDPAQGKLQRLYLDLEQCKLGKDMSRSIPVEDNLLENIRAGQFTLETVRVVIDIKSFEDYDVFYLQNPFRIVIDVRGENDKKTNVARVPDEVVAPSTGPKSLAEQLSLGVRRIVIDAGHGGKDGGAPGYQKGLHEKAITLSLARKLADQIRREIGCEVVLTRGGDSFLTLEERTAIANTKNADLFVSIHTNACRSNNAYGIETYILNIATDEDAMEVAARENATSTKNISDLQMILRDLMQNTKINESSRLAGFVQGSLCGHLKKNYSRIKDKGVKQAPFYVLLGAQMPAVLIEAGFISDKTECGRLADTSYQNKVCEGIVKGIKEYMRHTKMAAFSNGEDG